VVVDVGFLLLADHGWQKTNDSIVSCSLKGVKRVEPTGFRLRSGLNVWQKTMSVLLLSKRIHREHDDPWSCSYPATDLTNNA